MIKTTCVLGFSSLDKEVSVPSLALRGTIPGWLKGTLVRNGPALFEVGGKPLQHWFDGLAMLHRFSFATGSVSYANRFIESQAYQYAKKNHVLGYSEFATNPDVSFLQRLKHVFKPQLTDNTNVNVVMRANKDIALTETPYANEYDKKTLNTLGPFYFKIPLRGLVTTAHPLYDLVQGEEINFLTDLGIRSKYRIYRIPKESQEPMLVGTIPTQKPAYMHSFSMTQHYIILCEYPFKVNPLSLLFINKPFIEHFKWQPNEPALFLVLDRQTGQLKGRFSAPAFFSFHHINAFELKDELVIDLSAYTDPSIIKSLYLDVLRGVVEEPGVTLGELRRYTISLSDKSVRYKILSAESMDLPRINYQAAQMKEYRYIYAVGGDKENPKNIFDRLLKIDIADQHTWIWQEEHCYPGEPVFVAEPNSVDEDKGVLLSVVLNTANNNSFLLILDAQLFVELARAEIPHHIPFGFHGNFYWD